MSDLLSPAEARVVLGHRHRAVPLPGPAYVDRALFDDGALAEMLAERLRCPMGLVESGRPTVEERFLVERLESRSDMSGRSHAEVSARRGAAGFHLLVFLNDDCGRGGVLLLPPGRWTPRRTGLGILHGASQRSVVLAPTYGEQFVLHGRVSV